MTSLSEWSVPAGSTSTPFHLTARTAASALILIYIAVSRSPPIFCKIDHNCFGLKWFKSQYFFFFLNILADSLRLDFISAEEIYINSKEVMTTVGEWELTGVTVKKMNLPAGDGKMYDEIRFHVSKVMTMSGLNNK